jgi:Predicted dehydrogenases and related proteins
MTITFRIGFIGAGLIAGNYMASLDKLGQRVAAVCDIDSSQAQKVAARYGCPVYQDHKMMLKRERLDVVFVAIPPGAHTTQVADAASSGAAVFSTKPVALDLETARRTLDAILEAGVINQVGYMARYSDITEKARELVGNQPLALGIGRVFYRLKEHPWWGKKEISGGQMLEQSTHLFDLFRYFLGEADEAHAYGHKGMAREYTDSEDCTVCNIRFVNGAVASVSSTCCANAINYFTAELSGCELYIKLVIDELLEARVGEARLEHRCQEEGYFRQIEHFLRAVERNDQSMVRSSYEDAARTLALTVATNHSLKTGRPEKVMAISS